MFDIEKLKSREKIEKYTKYIENTNKSNLVNHRKEKDYDYYLCDYCKSEIRLNLKQHERSGGIVILPHTLTKCGNITVVLCNKCVKEVQKELEERLNKV